jgi:hypothetical protein
VGTGTHTEITNNQIAQPTIVLNNELLGSDSGPISQKDWTGFYTITLLVLRSATEDVRKALQDVRLVLDESYAEDGLYPTIVFCGAVQNARPLRGGAIGFNYLEVFSVIPGVRLQQPDGGSLGPYLYPYKGYVNHLIPCVLGRLSGFPKVWDRVSLTRSGSGITSDGFSVSQLITRKPILSGRFSLDSGIKAAPNNSRVGMLSRLLPPDIIGVNFFGKLVRTSFKFYYEQGTAQDVNDADVQIYARDLIPGISDPTSYKQIGWSENDNRYRPVRLFVPWRLTEKAVLYKTERPQAVPLTAAKAAGR